MTVILQPDLFGGDTRVVSDKVSSYQKTKLRIMYREADKKEKSCKTCGQCMAFAPSSKKYYKCRIIGISRSDATDIRLKNVCNAWEKYEPKTPDRNRRALNGKD